MRRKRVLLGIGALVLVFGTRARGRVCGGERIRHSTASRSRRAAPARRRSVSRTTCTYSIRNKIDEAQDTLTINGLTDIVHAAGGDVSSGNVFSSLRFVIGAFLPGFSTPPTCTGRRRATAASAIRSAGRALTSCTLPFGSRINVLPFSFYTVRPPTSISPATC